MMDFPSVSPLFFFKYGFFRSRSRFRIFTDFVEINSTLKRNEKKGKERAGRIGTDSLLLPHGFHRHSILKRLLAMISKTSASSRNIYITLLLSSLRPLILN